jgi:hypothetical protein
LEPISEYRWLEEIDPELESLDLSSRALIESSSGRSPAYIRNGDIKMSVSKETKRIVSMDTHFTGAM